MHIFLATVSLAGFLLMHSPTGWSEITPVALQDAWWLVHIHKYTHGADVDSILTNFLHQFKTEEECEAVKARSDVGQLECQKLVFESGGSDEEKSPPGYEKPDPAK
jgi:hypothetical protein